MKKIICLFACLLTGSVNAALLNFDGFISDYSDVILTEFTVSSDQTVRAWTDSYDNGANFDPITALWASDGSFLIQNDDNSSIDSGQTSYDSGITTFLTAGTYYFTISVYSNFADSTLNVLSGPSPFGCDNCLSTRGNLYYSQWFDGIESATVEIINSVPEPTSLVLFALSLAGIGLSRKKKTA